MRHEAFSCKQINSHDLPSEVIFANGMATSLPNLEWISQIVKELFKIKWRVALAVELCIYSIYEPPHDKTNKMTVCPAKTWISLGIRMKKAWVLSYQLSKQRRLIRLGIHPGWSESLLGAQSFCWFCHEAAQLCTISQVYLYPQHLCRGVYSFRLSVRMFVH